MKLSHIRDFLGVIECGSMASASRALGVSQPGITKSIRTLEQELGVQLLQRTTRGVSPTRYGRALYHRAKAAHSELQKATQDIAQLAGGQTAYVALGVGPVIAELILPEAIPIFRNEFPHADLRVVEGFAHTLLPLVRDSTVEFAVTARLPEFKRERGISFRPLFFHDRVVVGRKGNPFVRSKTLPDLCGASWVTFEPRVVLEREFARRKLQPPKSVILCESYTGFVRLLETSDMVGILPRSVLAASPAREVLRALDLEDTLASITVGLFSRSDSPLTPAANAMAKAISNTADKLVRAFRSPRASG